LERFYVSSLFAARKGKEKKKKKMALCLVNNMGRETNVEERKKE
jgi:hypothetical protein